MEFGGVEGDGHAVAAVHLGICTGLTDDRYVVAFGVLGRGGGGCPLLGQILGGGDGLPVPGAVDEGLAAQGFHDIHGYGEGHPPAARRLSFACGRAIAVEDDVVGARADDHGVLTVHVAGGYLIQMGEGDGKRDPAGKGHEDRVSLSCQCTVPEIHTGRTDESGDETIGGVVVEVLGGVDLLDVAPSHDHDAAAHGHGFDLVVGDVDEGRSQSFVEADDLGAHGGTEFGVEVGEGFIEQKHLGTAHDGAAEGDALTLAAREGAGLSVKVLGDAENGGGLHDLLMDDVLFLMGGLEGKGHVLIDRHMGVEGVVLKDHGDVAVAGFHVVDDDVVDAEFPGRDIFETCDHAQGGGFPATAGADKDNELTVTDLHIKVVDRLGRAVVDLVDVFEG